MMRWKTDRQEEGNSKEEKGPWGGLAKAVRDVPGKKKMRKERERRSEDERQFHNVTTIFFFWLFRMLIQAAVGGASGTQLAPQGWLVRGLSSPAKTLS